MFESFYGLNANPFRLSPDERFLYVHSSYVKARAYLKYALERAEGLVMVTGPPGTGKTLLVQDILSELNPAKTLVAHLVSNQLHAEDLLRMLALVFGFHAETYDKATLLNLIQRYVAEQHEAGRRAILIIDDAQNLPVRSLEELRLLSNLQTADQSLIQIFLIGQDELRGIILRPGMEQFSQRLIATCRIEAMNSYQTREYIEHRLDIAGWKHDPLLDPEIFPLIHRFSQGVPRQINHLVGRLLLFGALEGKHSLHEDDVWTVLEELHEEHLLPPFGDESLAAVKSAYTRPSPKDRSVTAKAAVAEQPIPPATSMGQSAKPTTQDGAENSLLTGLEQGPIVPPGLFDESPPEPPQAAGESSPDTRPSVAVQNDQPAHPPPSKTKLETSSDASTATRATTQSRPTGEETQPVSATPPDDAIPSDIQTSAPRKGNNLLRWVAYTLSAVLILLALVVPKPRDLTQLWQAIVQQGQSMLRSHQPGQETAPAIPADAATRNTPGLDSGPVSSPHTERPEPDITERMLLDIAPPPHLAPNPQTVESMANAPSAAADAQTIEATARAIPATPEPQTSAVEAHSASAAADAQTIEGRIKPVSAVPEPQTSAVEARSASAAADAQTIEGRVKPVSAVPEAQTIEAPARDPLPAPEPQAVEATAARHQSLQVPESPSIPQSRTEAPLAQAPSELDETHQLLFGFDSSEIDPEHIPVLDGIIASLRQYAQSSVQITGFTDSSGDPVYNKLLATRRANTIAKHLTEHGIAPERIHTLGQGPLPEAAGKEVESRQDRSYKRRVELRVTLPVSTTKSSQ